MSKQLHEIRNWQKFVIESQQKFWIENFWISTTNFGKWTKICAVRKWVSNQYKFIIAVVLRDQKRGYDVE